MIADFPEPGRDDTLKPSMHDAVFRELVHDGKAIIFSSHRLDHVEELSDAVGIIHQSELVLYGGVNDIMAAQSSYTLRIGADSSKSASAFLSFPHGRSNSGCIMRLPWIRRAFGVTRIRPLSCRPPVYSRWAQDRVPDGGLAEDRARMSHAAAAPGTAGRFGRDAAARTGSSVMRLRNRADEIGRMNCDTEGKGK
ncbi:MAG: hypothetical protein K6T83_11505 [Alicyclobacillus sp.]|nr:hypothetical protein [Alicyclobacillus sp.]